MLITEALHEMTEKFQKAGIESAGLDAQVILADLLGIERYRLIADSREKLTKNNIEKLHSLTERRLNREPVAYITGKKEFYSIEFRITPDVLIPRPETEQLVDLAIYHAVQGSSLLDIGTGSGAIAIAVKKNRPDLAVFACDISKEALKVAKKNAGEITGENSITFMESDLFSAYKGKKFDIILSNPPYMDKTQRSSLQKELSYEPEFALFAEDSGRETLQRIIMSAAEYLNSRGLLIMETGSDQADYIREISSGQYSASILKDYAYLPRIALLQKI